MNSTQLLPAIRDLCSRHPEMYYLEPWETQSALFVLGYTNDLAEEAAIAAAARTEELRKAEAFVRERLRELGRIRLALLQDIWHDAGGDPWSIPVAVEALGCRVEALPDFDNRRFVFAASEAEGAA